jgi:site-specific recombinase XerD
MKTQAPNDLARAIKDYFGNHLPGLRGMSPHTVRSYRDTMTLLLRFVARENSCDVVALDLDHLGVEVVLAFLQHLEQERRNSAATRNVRLAAIHAFFRYLAGYQPVRLDHCQRILAIPFKRSRTRAVEYLEREEIEAVFSAVDQRSPDGRRDYALLVTMFNTGARVQEVLGLRPCDLQLVRPYHARLFGKGRKERFCPLWPQTADLLRDLLAERETPPLSVDPMFLNHRREPLTRFGVRYILAKYCNMARPGTPTLERKRLHPHSMRHSTAVHLMKSGVDLVTISHWLGHASVNTTNRYASVDLETKRQAISKLESIPSASRNATSWRSDPSILAWLQAL